MSYLQELLKDQYKEGMTEEELSEAVKSAITSIQKNVPDINNLKNALNKATSEASNYKKQLQEKMTAEEKEKADQKALFDKLVADNEEMKKKIAVTESKAQFIALGYPEELAVSTAEALYNGDNAQIFASIKALLEAKEKQIRADVVTSTPVPPAGAGSTANTMTKEQFNALTVREQMELYQKDPNTYSKFIE